MYVLHPHSRLTPFYAVYIQQQWRLNAKSLTHIAQICSSYSTEQPIDLRLATVDRYVHEQIALNQDLTNLVVTELYQNFSIVDGLVQSGVSACASGRLTPKVEVAFPAKNHNRQIWINFIHYMSEKLITNTWNRLPEYKRVESTLDLLRTATLVAPEKLFEGFDRAFDRDLLNGIERWTYRFLRNSVSSQIRAKDQFFGLSSLGVISKSTKLSIRKALASQTFNNVEGLSDYNLKDRSIVDTLLVDIYKSYLSRTQIRTDRLAAQDWQQIELEVQKQWSNLELDLPPPSIDKIQVELKLIGGCVRGAESISFQSIDAGNMPSAIVAQRSGYYQAYSQLFEILNQTIATLDPLDLRLLELRYRDGLTQLEISLIIERDQSIVSKKITHIEKIILKSIHQKLRIDLDPPVKIDRTSIRAMKDALKDFYNEPALTLHS